MLWIINVFHYRIYYIFLFTSFSMDCLSDSKGNAEKPNLMCMSWREMIRKAEDKLWETQSVICLEAYRCFMYCLRSLSLLRSVLHRAVEET